MACMTTYTCDQCKKLITGPFGPLHVTIIGEVEPEVNASLDLCSFECLRDYAADGSPAPVPLRGHDRSVAQAERLKQRNTVA